MKKRIYAREITKEYLQKCGVEYVDETGRKVIINGKEANIFPMASGNKEYYYIRVYDPDERQAVPKEKRKTNTGQHNIGIHIVNYVWNIADKPLGLVIDHIDNNPLNNHISNLQLLTPRENVNKDSGKPQRVVVMPKYITEEEILRKLEGYEMAYEQAKADHDAKAAHHLRANLSVWRAKHRQFLENPEKYTKPENNPNNKTDNRAAERDCHARAEKRRELQANIDSSRKYYKEALEAYGKNDPYVKQLWGVWKTAIAELYAFKEEIKNEKIR